MVDTETDNDKVKKSEGKTDGQVPGTPGPIQNRIVMLQAIIIVLLLINSLVLFWIMGTNTSKSAVLTVVSEDQIVLEVETTIGSNITYNIYVDLKNVGEGVAHLSATGEVLVSLYGSAYGEEVQKVLNYLSGSISPGETKRLDLGTFTTSPGWHYVIRARVSWNGGTLELTRLVV